MTSGNVIEARVWVDGRADVDAGVKVFVRIGDNEEVVVGTAHSSRDVPLLLQRLAEHLMAGMRPDPLEEPSGGSRGPS